MKDSPFISIVIPVYNEEANLDELLTRCLKVCREMERSFEIILIDDGSTDKSPVKIKKAAEENFNQVIGVFLNRNYGQHAAIMAGFSNLRGDIIITLDADLQNPPEEIPKLIRKAEEGFDVVGGVRAERADSFYRRVASSIINKVVRMTTGVMMHDYGCMLRAYSRPIVEAMLQCHERSTFIPVLANSFAQRTTEIEVNHSKRSAGDSKYGLWKLINLQFDLLTGMTTFPIRILSVLGGLVSVAGIGLGTYILIMRLLHGAAWALEGVFTLFAILFVFIGAQFIAMGLLGEYIGRIYHDVRARPQYLIQRIIGIKRPEKED